MSVPVDDGSPLRNRPTVTLRHGSGGQVRSTDRWIMARGACHQGVRFTRAGNADFGNFATTV